MLHSPKALAPDLGQKTEGKIATNDIKATFYYENLFF